MVDDVVAKIYKVLDDNSISENTIVIFTNDNGSNWMDSDIEKFGHSANYIFSEQKSDIWQEGHRVPYILTYPALVKQNRDCEELVSSTDLLATCADMLSVGLANDVGEDSYSFWSEVTGISNEDTIKRESMIYHSIDGYFGFQQGDIVLLNCKGSGGWSLPEQKAKYLPDMQLYNLKTDISEKNNIVDSNIELAQTMF